VAEKFVFVTVPTHFAGEAILPLEEQTSAEETQDNSGLVEKRGQRAIFHASPLAIGA